MFFQWTSVDDLDSRLDSYRYSPTFLEALCHLREAPCSISRLKAVRDAHSSINYGILQPRAFLPTGGVPMVRAVDLGNPFIDKKKVVCVPTEVEQPYHRSRIRKGDVLICPSNWNIANINQSVARLRISEQNDSHFIAMYLMSPIGQTLLAREAVGSVQRHYNLEDIPGILLPIPCLQIQRAIGNKVRKAERLYEFSCEAKSQANNATERYLPSVIASSLSENPRWFTPDVFSSDSLAPEYNRSIEGHMSILDPISLLHLVETCKCGIPIRSDQRTKGKYLYYGASGPMDTHNQWNFEGQHLIVSQDGSIGYACVAEGHFWANNHVWVLKLKNGYDPYAIAHYLTNVYPYWSGMTTGSVVPKVTSENLLKVVVPKGIAEAHAEIGSKLLQSSIYLNMIPDLIELAKLDIQALINGTLDEKGLLAEGEEIMSWLEANPGPYSSNQHR